ncbi:hypothetical protein ABNF65_12935 [Paenibacillus larvae]
MKTLKAFRPNIVLAVISYVILFFLDLNNHEAISSVVTTIFAALKGSSTPVLLALFAMFIFSFALGDLVSELVRRRVKEE